MLAVQLVTASYVHSFVFPPSCHRFLSGVVWSLRFPGDKEACLRRLGEEHPRHAPRMVHREKTADWSEDGSCAVQTHDARRGERREPRIFMLCADLTAPP